MSKLKYFSYKGYGEYLTQNVGYSMAVRVDNRIECSGQGGGDVTTGKKSTDINEQIDQAFVVVDACLKDAGGKGWSQVFRVNSYHLPLNNEALTIMSRNFKKWMPDHNPIWTAVGVQRLGTDDMRVEIEVVAYDPEGAQAAGK